MSTFEYQPSLKKLPIPDLEETLEKYIQVLKPLQTENEHSQTVASCQKFLHTVGPVLQRQLVEYAKSRDSYIEQFWYDSYLNYDSPVVLNLNPFIMLEDDPTPLKSTQVSRAASLTTSSLRFVRALRKNELSVDKLKNGAPLDMDQYPKLFGSSRVPTRTGCVLQTDTQSRHIVVLSKSQFYWFDALDDNNDLILTELDIKLNLQSIVDDSETTSVQDIAKSSFGVLTTENRRIWAGLREKIVNDPVNSEILKILDSALFVVVLDNVEVGSDLTRMAKNFLCGESRLENGVQIGTCTNRWYDKLQLIVTKDAKVGINFEHTGVDGHTVLRFASDIYTDSILRFARTINVNSPSLWKSVSPDPATRDPASFGNVMTSPRKLEWDLTTELSLALRFGETRLSDLIHQNEFSTLEFRSYGMERIKKMGMSPDAFVQMGFQLAYYALYGKIESTYEPSMTKQFLHGRTEAIRTVSLQSNEFVTKFLDEHVSVRDKVKLLKDACAAHSARTRDCSKGLGQDRHLYALFCIWKRYYGGEPLGAASDSDDENTLSDLGDLIKDTDLSDVPSIFADAGWDKLNNTIISTSNCGNPSLKLFGFGPVSANGFGLGYIIKDNSITICASSKHRQTQRFMDTLNSSFLEMEQVYVESLKPDEEASFGQEVVNKLQDLRVGRTRPAIIRLLGGYDSFEVDSNSDLIKSREHSPEPPFSRHKVLTTRDIGKKLRLAEY